MSSVLMMSNGCGLRARGGMASVGGIYIDISVSILALWNRCIFNPDFDKRVRTFGNILISAGGRNCMTRATGGAVDNKGMVIVGFDCDVLDPGTGDFAVEEVAIRILFEIETGNETVHEAVTV
jgi:hypothetical protein